MKNKVLIIALALLSVLVLASCGRGEEPPQITAPKESVGRPDRNHQWVDGEEEFGHVKYPDVPEKYDRIFERGYNFSVFYTEANKKPFFIQIFNDDGVIFKTIETVCEPIIREEIGGDNTVVAVSTAESMSDPYKVIFYDITNSKVSEPKENFISAEYGYAVFVNENGFIISDMFDDSVFYKEIPIDTEGFAKADKTYMSAQFSPNGKNVIVSYTVNGEDYDVPFKLK